MDSPAIYDADCVADARRYRFLRTQCAKHGDLVAFVDCEDLNYMSEAEIDAVIDRYIEKTDNSRIGYRDTWKK